MKLKKNIFKFENSYKDIDSMILVNLTFTIFQKKFIINEFYFSKNVIISIRETES
jgi:hypothetical protein